MSSQKVTSSIPANELIRLFTEQARKVVVCRRIFAELFESGHDSALSLVAQYLFEELNEVLREYILLQSAKLLDDESTKIGGLERQNVTCAAVQAAISDPAKRKRLEALKLDGFRPYIRAARNRIITHSDAESLSSGVPLGTFPVEVGDRFFQGVQDYVDILMDGVHPLLDQMVVNDVQNVIRLLRDEEERRKSS